MKSWIKRWLRHSFGLVPYERIDEIYSRWIQQSSQWSRDRSDLTEAVFKMSEIINRQNAELQSLRDKSHTNGNH